jgi:2-iminobutanoate/2-iminopropanoate deaminase
MNWEVKHHPMYYAGVKQIYANVQPGRGVYAKSVVVGNLIFCSGMTAQDVQTGKTLVHDMEAQMTVVLDKVRSALDEAGSNMNNIVKTLMLIKDVKDYPAMRKAESDYYKKYAPRLLEFPPASTFMQPAALARPEYLIEMDVVAVVHWDK